MNALKVNNRCFVLAIGFWALLPSMVKCQPETVRQQIQDVLQKTDVSFQHKDINGCLAMLAEDFQGTDIDGYHFDKAGTKRSLIRVFYPSHLITESTAIKSQVLSVASSGSQANVVYYEHLITTIGGQITHQKHILTLDTLRRSVWIKTKYGWREKSETQVTSRIKRDGVLQSVKDKK